MNKKLESKLVQFRENKQIVNVGALGTVLIITRKAKKLGLPLDPGALITEGGGQVSGLSGNAINKILREHGVSSSVGTESGRTSRGTPSLARAYAEFLNELNRQGLGKLNEIEAWWVARFVDYFNTEPFKLNYDQSKTLGAVLRNLLDQAIERQRKSPGKTYIGAVLQHLVGAKLELALPEVNIIHNGFSVADAVSDRSGDFVIDDVIIHCTTAPTEALLKKCKTNLQSGKRPIILTISKMIGAAEGAAEGLGIDGRVEIMDALQFLAANLYEMSLFKAAQRKVTIEKLAEKYNEIIFKHESDASLRIDFG
ncbi:MAG: DUF4928 family protein [Gammaproteobacteria bacterium]|nr:DUF4928 family protein [Gammaproteobacteria bacterium]